MRTAGGLAAVGLLVSAWVLTRAEAGAREDVPPRAPVVVEGIVTYDGPIPDPIPIAEAGTVRHILEVDAGTRGLKDAVVWLEGVPAPPRGGRPTRERPVVMDQQNYFFVPHVLAVEAGRPVEFANGDIANHGVTAASLEPRNCFNVTTPQGGGYTHRFAASKYPVAIGCPIHAARSAWVYVFDHPYHAVTDASGRFRLPPAPPGRYRLQVRHADGGLRREEEVAARDREPVRLRLEFREDDLRIKDRKGRSPR